MPKMGFRADGDENVYVYLESKSGSAIVGVDAADNNRLKMSASTAISLNPDTASPMVVLDPRTGGGVGEGDITLLPKGLAGSGNVSIDSGGLVVASLNTGVVQTDSLGFFSSTAGNDGQILVGDTGGAPAWANITSTGGTVAVSNGANTINLEVATGTGVVKTLTGTTGGAISPTAGNINLLTANTTVPFVGAGSTLTWDAGTTDNTLFGCLVVGSITTAANNAGVGYNIMGAITDATNNVAVGHYALATLQHGNGNVAVGAGALDSLNAANNTFGNNVAVGASAGGALNANGSSNTLLGAAAGLSLTGNDSSNILINHTGSAGLNNTLRIGAATGSGTQQLTAAYICGIDGVNVGSVAKVLTMASDQIGTATITAGTGISVTPGANTITIANTSTGLTWTDVVGTSQAAAVNNGYTTNNAGLVTVTIPDTAAYGSIIRVVGKGAGGWAIAQNAGESIHFAGSTTTVGVGGSLASTAQYDCVELLCTVANTEWTVISSIGNITVV